MRVFQKSLLAAALLAAPFLAQAESNFVTGNGALTANARLDFQITVPRVLYLRVGAGNAMANNTAVNLIDFNVPAAQVGNGTAVAATAASGDLGNGTVTARLIGNGGAITFSSTTTGALSNGAGDTISYAAIATSVASLAGVSEQLMHPALADGTTTSLNLTPTSGRVINRGAQWTYTYSNAAVVAPGTYGGVNTQNGRVTYTASMP
jgi:hypothetical protein